MSRIFSLLVIIAAMISCTKQEVPRYKEPDAVTFYYNNGEADSVSYSFATVGYGRLTDTVYLQMRVLGTVTAADRPVQLRAVEGSTARPNVDYKLPDFVVRAGVSSFLYPLLVYKTPEMNTEILRLILEVVPNSSFPGIAAEGLVAGLTTDDNTYSHNRIKVDLTDKLIKPNAWPTKFGTYSDVKYGFVIQTLGTGDFRLTSQGGVWTSANLDLARVVLREALVKYELANGALIDETGVRVTF
jgi:hypothetical protein